MEPTSLYHPAITPSILKLIVQKMRPATSVNFCQTGQFGKFYAEKYQKEALEKYENHVAKIREYRENHLWIKEYKEIDDVNLAAIQFISEAEEAVDQMLSNEERPLQAAIDVAKSLIEKGKLLDDYNMHRVAIQKYDAY